MKQTSFVILALALVFATPTSAQYENGKLALILRDEALEDMTVESDGSATLPNATSLNSLNSQNELVAMYPMSRKSGSAFRGFFTFTFADTANLSSLKQSYENNEFVQWVSEIPSDTAEPLDPYYPDDAKFSNDRMWYVHQGTNRADVNGPEAWEWTLGSADIVIAICGGGVKCLTDPTHVEFSADVAANLWTNPGEIPNNGIDDDNNGYIDDMHGWNLNFNNNDIENSQAADPLWWHATPMASHATSAIDTCTSKNCGVGVAPSCKIMGLPSASFNSLIYATDNGAKVFVYAFTFNTTYYRRFIDTAFAHGTLFVNAAGNTGTTIYQSGYGVSVARLDSSNNPTTTTGDSVKLSAPALYGGSSWAAPVAGGVAALMRSINPYIPLGDLRAIFIDTSSCNTVAQSGTGSGRIDAFKAIKNVTGTPYLEYIDITEPDEKGFIHPILNWQPNRCFSAPALSEYIIQKRRPFGIEYQAIDSVTGSTTSYVDTTEYIPTEWTPSAATEYRIRAKLVYSTSIVLSVPSNVQSVGSTPMEKTHQQVSIERSPATTRLVGNYPNPFNPTTRIRFDIAEEGFVSLRVFDVLGREVSTLVSKWMLPGSYSEILDLRSLATSVYLYRLQAGRLVDTGKLILTK
jgi:hypothetical protein